MQSNELWTAGISTPVDCAEKPGTVTRRKLRPITLTEHLLQLAESVGFDTYADKVTRAFEPVKLGSTLLMETLSCYGHFRAGRRKLKR